MQPQEERPRVTDPEFVKNLPPVTLSDSDEKAAKKECNICLEPVQEGAKSAQLPCGHGFDRSCIETWLS